MKEFSITKRKAYTDKILNSLEDDDILLVTGVRRAGKSCIAKLLEDEMRRKFTDGDHIVRINFETIDSICVTADELIAKLQKHYTSEKKNYFLLDEVIHVVEWERAVNYFYQLKNCKIVLFSSSRRVFSDNLIAIQEQRYSVVQVLPLSLREFIQFHGFREVIPVGNRIKDKRYCRLDKREYTLEEIYNYYIIYGGLPVQKPEYMDRERAWIVTDGSYGAIVTRDITEAGSDHRDSAVTDTLLLRTIITIMAKSLGDNISATWIGKQIVQILGRTSATKTVESYIRALLTAHLFYIAERVDIKTGKVLKTLAKYYIVDACFHNYVADIHVDDEHCLLENKVFFELLRRGYQVYNGKYGQEEVSFVAINGREKAFIQVADSANKLYIETLCSPLRKIRESHPKVVIALGSESGITDDGIIILNALEYLMGKDWGR